MLARVAVAVLDAVRDELFDGQAHEIHGLERHLLLDQPRLGLHGGGVDRVDRARDLQRQRGAARAHDRPSICWMDRQINAALQAA